MEQKAELQKLLCTDILSSFVIGVDEDAASVNMSLIISSKVEMGRL